MRRVDDKEPLALYVYKTMTDPFAGQDFVSSRWSAAW